MKPAEIRNMTEEEIYHKITALKEQFFNLRSEASTGQVERPNRFRSLKRDIAKCLTILKEKKSGK